MREREVEQYLVQRVKALGGGVRKLRFLDRRAAPDRLVGFRVGVPVWLVEVKRPGEKPTAAQYREHDRLRALGLNVIVVDSPDAVDAFLQEFPWGGL